VAVAVAEVLLCPITVALRGLPRTPGRGERRCCLLGVWISGSAGNKNAEKPGKTGEFYSKSSNKMGL